MLNGALALSQVAEIFWGLGLQPSLKKSETRSGRHFSGKYYEKKILC